MKASEHPLYGKIAHFALDEPHSARKFSDRLAQENRWNGPYARQVVQEYKRFLFLAAVSEHEVTPSDQIDQAWHLHMIYTRNYWDDFCDGVLGRRIHHGPSRGGPTDSKKYREQYEQTLDSYRRWFGEEPASAIWPPCVERFGPLAQSVRVCPHEVWIVPKPWGALARWKARGSMLVPALAPLLLGAFNPLEIPGPAFLSVYVPCCLLALLAAVVMRHSLRSPDDGAEESDLSPEEVACLARGESGALQAALAALVARGQVRVMKEHPPTIGFRINAKYRLCADEGATESPSEMAGCDSRINQALLGAARAPMGVALADALRLAKPAAEKISRSLQRRGLLETPSSFAASRWWPVAALSAVVVLGIVKFGWGAAREKPVGYLLGILVVMAMATVLFSCIPRRTRKGNRVHDQLKSRHRALRTQKWSGPNNQDEFVGWSNIALAVGLFGLTTVDHPDVRQLSQAIRTAPPGLGGDSSACGGGGGGCGGGGCGGGGCGGCGGCGGGCGG